MRVWRLKLSEINFFLGGGCGNAGWLASYVMVLLMGREGTQKISDTKREGLRRDQRGLGKRFGNEKK